ncbi:flagellin [Bacillus sp. Brlt_9]|uniref:flagellin n=1 Tax=Bacillus sp. Brlt_9 TaxID=3110916 RepID=UPI003F7BEA88
MRFDPSISTNIRNQIQRSEKYMNNSYRSISTGNRINTGADDAAGLSISERLVAAARGKDQAIRNVQDGISFLGVAEGTIGVMQDMYQRIRELSVQAGNSTYSNNDKKGMQAEVKSLLDQIDNLANNSTFNGINLFSKIDDNVSLHIDETAKGTLDIRMYDLTTAAVGIDWIDVTIDNQSAINAVDTVINNISKMRSEYGAYMNRLDARLKDLSQGSIQHKNSNSVIKETDMATEMSNLVKEEIKFNTSSKMLTVSNSHYEKAVQLLTN